MTGADPGRPVVGCLAVVRRIVGGKSRILLVERSKPPGIGKWGFPGGHLELGETIREAAIRELLEETGIVAVPASILTAFDFIEKAEGRTKRHFALIAVLCDWREGEGAPLQDATRIGWFTLAEAETFDTFPDALPAMRLVLDS
jgi:8-oxo-dGTP diphosphatase